MKAETIEQKMTICGADVESKEPGLKEHSDEVEFAYYALKQFVEYCSLKPNGKGIGLTKDILGAHLNGGVTLCYRTKKYQPRAKGFGVSDKQACRQPYSEAYNVKTKCVKNKNEIVAMIAYEITAPNTTEAIRIKNIVLSYFPRSYWEFTSLDQTTITVYIKIVYDVVMTRRDDVFNVCKLTETKINNILSGRGQQGRAILMSMPVLASSLDRTPMARLPRFNQDSTKTQLENTSLIYFAPTYNILDTFESFNAGLSNYSRDLGDLDCFSKLSDSLKNSYNKDVYPVSEFEMQLKYYQSLSRDYGYVVPASEALRQYKSEGFSIAGTKDPIARFEYLEKLVSKTFDPKKYFSFCGFERQKARICKFLDSRLQRSNLTYKKRKVAYQKGEETRYIKLEQIGSVYFAMLKLQTFKRADCIAFGRKTVQKVLKYYELNSQPNVACQVLESLERLGLIRNVANHIAGVRSNVWSVIQISFLPDKAA
jgi:hypothetical protein